MTDIIENKQNKKEEKKGNPQKTIMLYVVLAVILTILIIFAPYILLAVIILCVTIFIHELGHYTAGRILKFKIKEFAIGFGPKIISKKNKRGEIISLRAIPLGGFCAFAGEDVDDPNPDAFNNQKPWKRIIVLVSGGLFNIVSAIIFCIPFLAVAGNNLPEVAFIHDTPNAYHTIEKPNGIMEGDVIIAVNGRAVTVMRDLSSLLRRIEDGEPFTLTVRRKFGENDIREIDLEGIIRTEYNRLHAQTRIIKYEKVGSIPERFEFVVIGDYMRDRNGNILTDTGIGFTPRQGQYYERDGHGNVIFDFEGGASFYIGRYYLHSNNQKQADKWIELEVEGDEHTWKDNLGATGTFVMDESKFSLYDNLGARILIGVNAGGTINALDNDNKLLVYRSDTRGTPRLLSAANERLSGGEVIGYSFAYPFKIVGQIFDFLGGLFTGRHSVADMTGPFGTIGFMAEASQVSAVNILILLPMLAVNLGIFNLLPIPALDGSKVIFCSLEWIKGKPVVSRKTEGTIHLVGILALLIFALSLDMFRGFGALRSCMG
jgi:regulator of sigma E protease